MLSQGTQLGKLRQPPPFRNGVKIKGERAPTLISRPSGHETAIHGRGPGQSHMEAIGPLRKGESPKEIAMNGWNRTAIAFQSVGEKYQLEAHKESDEENRAFRRVQPVHRVQPADGTGCKGNFADV